MTAAWGGCLALGVILLLCAGGFGQWLMNPPEEHCALPVLDVPRPGPAFCWSPDGSRLLVGNLMGEVWVVQFPDRSVRRLPSFTQPIRDGAWDASGCPLLVWTIGSGQALHGLARLRADGAGWDRIMEGVRLSPSPNGKWGLSAVWCG